MLPTRDAKSRTPRGYVQPMSDDDAFIYTPTGRNVYNIHNRSLFIGWVPYYSRSLRRTCPRLTNIHVHVYKIKIPVSIFFFPLLAVLCAAPGDVRSIISDAASPNGRLIHFERRKLRDLLVHEQQRNDRKNSPNMCIKRQKLSQIL